ncbi:hypothetical protein D3C73_397150 [compost metagenome]
MTGVDLTDLQQAGTPLEAAQAIKALGGKPVPVRRGEERRPLVKWKEGYDPADANLPGLFAPYVNVAFIAGTAASGLVDIDLDCEAAVAFGDILFADCPSFGRGARPRSHRQIHCPGARTAKYEAPKAAADDAAWKGAHGTCIVEIQADGKLVTVPPSVHPKGEPYEWGGRTAVAPTWSAKELSMTIGALAFMVVFDAYYPTKGGRHDACLAASGVLVRAGLTADLTDELVQTAARRNSDEEWGSRTGAHSAVVRLETGERVAGVVALMDRLGLAPYWEQTLRKWLTLEELEPLVINTNAPRDTARDLLQRDYTTPQGRTLTVAQDSFYMYRDGVWRGLTKTEVKEVLYSFMERGVVRVKEGGTRRFTPKASDVSLVLDALQPLVSVGSVVPPMWLDGRSAPPANEIVAFPNGMIHAPTLTWMPHTPQLFTLNQLPIHYDVAAPHPERWLAWLNSLWSDAEAVNLVQEILGLSLVPDTSLQKIIMFYGPPRAGKGVLTSIMQDLLGPANFVSPGLSSLGENFGTQSLLGKLMAFVPDARLDMSARRNGVTQTLLAISGEDSQTVPRKHVTAWHGKLPIRFLITTNEIPQLRDDAGALMARIVPVVFDRSFVGKESRGLKASLREELPGILVWSLEGYRRLKKRGDFVLPAGSQELIGRMGAVFSQMGTFIEDCAILDDDAQVLFSDLFIAYQLWAEEQGLRQSMTRTQLGERLNERRFRSSQPRPDKARVRHGLRLNEGWARRVSSRLF